MLTKVLTFALQYKRTLALLAAILCLLGLVWHDKVERDKAAEKTLRDSEKYKSEPATLASPKKAFENYQTP